MPSNYPGSFDTFATSGLSGAIVGATDHQDKGDALNKIERELGVNPSGAFADVDARLNSIGAQVGEYFAAAGETAIKASATTAAAAGGGIVWVPAGTHTFASAWTPGDNVWIRGYGRGPTILRHNFSGDFITLGTNTCFSHITVDDVSGTNTGKGMKITGNFGSQILEHVNVLGFGSGSSSACLSFDHVDAGSGICVIGGRYAQRTGTSIGQEAIRIVDTQQLAATPRKFIGVESDGKRQFHLGGCNNVFIAGGGYMGEVVFTTESRGVMITGMRWGGQYTGESNTINIKGFNHHLTGDFGQNVVINSGSSAITVDGTYNGIVTDSSGFPQLNQIFSPQKTYTPVFTTSGGGQSLGNGTLLGTWSRQGTTITFGLRFNKGSTTNMGSGALRFTLPFAPASMSHEQVVSALMYNGSTNIYYSGLAVIENAVAYVTLRADGGLGLVTKDGPPFDFDEDTTLDQILITGDYLL